MTGPRLELTRSQILAYRRLASSLDERLPPGRRSLRDAAWAGLQDSMPRAAILSIHARLDAVESTVLDDSSLVQVWGPRLNAYVVAHRDLAPFTLGRLPDDPDARGFAQDLADGLEALLDGGRMTLGQAGRALGRAPNSLRYAAATGRVLISWDGARQPTVRTVPAPEVDPRDARLELARRYLHVLGPATGESFARWAGIPGMSGLAAFHSLRRSLTPVRTPIGEAWILTRDEPRFRADSRLPAPARLLPSGDCYFLLQGRDREILVGDPHLRSQLWTPRVWPGAVLVGGRTVGVWRRAREVVTVHPWSRLSSKAVSAVESEAKSLPLPGVDREIVVRWE